jgi:mono/diheme cytochrome c family protein
MATEKSSKSEQPSKAGESSKSKPTSSKRPLWKTLLMIVGGILALLLLTGASYAGYQGYAYDQSMAKVYDVPVADVTASDDADVIARGKHLTESIGACAMSDCHGTDLSGGNTVVMGPVGTFTGPNITAGGKLAEYSDGEIHRLIRHGIRRDGRSVQFMPVEEINWLPDDDIVAIISYLRTVPASDKTTPPTEFGILGKVLDRRDQLPLDVARRIDHDAPPPAVPEPGPTKAYGSLIARACTGCHGGTLSGGPIPGAPPDMPVPPNITPHETGIAHYDYDAFIHLLETGKKPDGKELDPFMPYKALAKMNDDEKKALWAYLQSVAPKPYGNR